MFLACDLPDAEARNRVLREMDRRGLLGRPCGTRSIRFRPVLSLTREEADEGLRRLHLALIDVFPVTAVGR